MRTQHGMMAGTISAVAIPRSPYPIVACRRMDCPRPGGDAQAQQHAFHSARAFPLGAVLCLGVAVVAAIFLAAGHIPQVVILPLGLPSLPFHARLDTLSGFFLLSAWFGGGWNLNVCCGLFSQRRGHAPRAALPAISLVSCQHGAGHPRRRCLLLHGGVGDDGAQFLLSGHLAAPHCGDPPRGLSLPPDGACRAHLHPAKFRCAARRKMAVHFRCDARRSAARRSWASAAFLLALLGFGAKAGLVPLHVWLPEAHPAAPSPVSAHDERPDAQIPQSTECCVSPSICLHVRYWWWGVLVLGARTLLRPLRSDLCRRADRHEASARLLLDRKHRRHLTGIGLAILFDASPLASLRGARPVCRA